MTLWRQKNNNFFSSFLNAKVHFSPRVETGKKNKKKLYHAGQLNAEHFHQAVFFINVPFILEHK